MSAERISLAVVGWLFATLAGGCAIAARSDKFGADLDIGVGGLIGYIADLRLKASVGFSKTCSDQETKKRKTGSPEEGHARNEGAGDPDPLGLDHFL